MQALILGLVQGVTEFLPISSSGFLILIPEFFGWDVQDVAFDAVIHLATLLAVIVALWGDIRTATPKMIKLIALATLPVLLVGGLFELLDFSPRSAQVVAWSFIFWGSVLYIVDRRAKEGTGLTSLTKNLDGWKKSLFIGACQAIALIPGTSRSGITITAGLASGLSREAATRFSFLLGVPTIAIAGLVKGRDVMTGSAAVELLPLVVGFIAAAVTAFLTIKVLLNFVKTHGYAEMAIFRIILGVLILLV